MGDFVLVVFADLATDIGCQAAGRECEEEDASKHSFKVLGPVSSLTTEGLRLRALVLGLSTSKSSSLQRMTFGPPWNVARNALHGLVANTLLIMAFEPECIRNCLDQGKIHPTFAIGHLIRARCSRASDLWIPLITWCVHPFMYLFASQHILNLSESST